MDVTQRLKDAETYLADNKRAGAVQELIDVCRHQQLLIDELDDTLRDVLRSQSRISSRVDRVSSLTTPLGSLRPTLGSGLD